MVLTSWLDNVIECRQNVFDAFNKLSFFTDKIAPNYIQTEDEQRRIQNLILAASECHLMIKGGKSKEDNNGDEGEPSSKIRKKVTCQLCSAKMILIEYECKIFNKDFNEDTQEGDGTWNPSYQEWILRVLHQTIRRGDQNSELLKQADDLLQMIEKYKNEYKELSKYWVEINYTASAFDELNMCKSQLQVVDRESLGLGDKKECNEIEALAIELTKNGFDNDLIGAESDFFRNKRTLAYLQHLSENPERTSCPICNQEPKDKYSVWDCGHQICFPCLVQMKKHYGLNLLCPVCRHSQQFKE